MTALFHAHSGLRFLVLAAGVLAVLVLAYALLSRRGVPAGRVLTVAFVGLLDLQVLLGIALVIGGIFYGALMGHLTMMILAAVSAHAASIVAHRSSDERRATTVRLVGVVVALALIAAGITAIGRGIFSSGVPTLGG